MDERTLARFWVKVNKDGPEVRPGLGKCWLWTASITPMGYGNFGVKFPRRRCALAHRVSFQLHYGDPGPLCVMHLCDQPGCVRPDHMAVGTRTDNQADMKAKGRSCRGEKAWISKVTEDDVRAIHAARVNERVADIAVRYGISTAEVYNICAGERWEHLGLERRPRARCGKLTLGDVEAIRSATETKYELADRYGVHPDYIQKIQAGRARVHRTLTTADTLKSSK
jgi:hypothetical protein